MNQNAKTIFRNIYNLVKDFREEGNSKRLRKKYDLTDEELTFFEDIFNNLDIFKSRIQ
jgi:hypothetical protein